MMTHTETNGHVCSENVDVELSHSQDSLKAVMNGSSVDESARMDEAMQDTPWDLEDIKATFEALLFVSHDPLTIEKLGSVLEGVPKSTLKTTMHMLQAEYDHVGRGLQITEVAGGFVMATRPEQRDALQSLSKPKTAMKLSRSTLDLLPDLR